MRIPAPSITLICNALIPEHIAKHPVSRQKRIGFSKDGTYVIHTTNGELEVDGETIAKQFKDPKLLSKDDMHLLAQKFHVRNKQQLSSKM